MIDMGKDKDKNDEIADSYQSIMPSIEAETIDRAKQLPQLERPDEFMKKIEIFLEDEF